MATQQGRSLDFDVGPIMSYILSDTQVPRNLSVCGGIWKRQSWILTPSLFNLLMFVG